MNSRRLALIAGFSYVGIFIAAIFANFVVLEGLLSNPLQTVAESAFMVRLGIVAFLVAALLDILVAWALYELYPEHPLSRLSAYLRLSHAIIMGLGVFVLPPVLHMQDASAILGTVSAFNMIWLIGLFFFGAHLILLSRILIERLHILSYILAAAGLMYTLDTLAHILIENYEQYADLFLMLVAVPSIIGEMGLTLWLLLKGGKGTPTPQKN